MTFIAWNLLLLHFMLVAADPVLAHLLQLPYTFLNGLLFVVILCRDTLLYRLMVGDFGDQEIMVEPGLKKSMMVLFTSPGVMPKWSTLVAW
jgi:hypothetical protein